MRSVIAAQSGSKYATREQAFDVEPFGACMRFNEEGVPPRGARRTCATPLRAAQHASSAADASPRSQAAAAAVAGSRAPPSGITR